jgi:predicted HTH domain antitoxin
MAITFELPELEEALRADYGNLNQAAKEALLIDAYRTGRLSIGRLSEALGFSVSHTMAWLGEHRVGPNYTLDEFLADRRTSDNLPNERP